MKLGKVVPILRIFDETMARRFYEGFLGFREDWAHRFEPSLPLYLQVSRDDCVLHLSEHHGDCTPGSALRIEVEDLDRFAAELASQSYGFARPSLETMPWGTRDLQVTDPFGNRLVFTDP